MSVAHRTRFDKKRVAVDFGEELSRAKQSFRDECDINQIMRRFHKTGQLPEMIRKNPSYGDFSEMPDYQAALEIVRVAEIQFAALPAEARDRFNNDPARFLAFVNDEKNAEEMVKLGLAVQRPSPEPPAPKAGKKAAKAADNEGSSE